MKEQSLQKLNKEISVLTELIKKHIQEIADLVAKNEESKANLEKVKGKIEDANTRIQ